jgi:hypothetical protein
VSEQIDRLCDQFRIKLHGIDRRFEALKPNGSSTSEKSRHLAESQMDSVEQRIFDRRDAVEAARARARAWGEGQRGGLAKVEEWQQNGQRFELDNRADDAEAYAVAAFELAIAAADEAVRASLEALLARSDAESLARTAGRV